MNLRPLGYEHPNRCLKPHRWSPPFLLVAAPTPTATHPWPRVSRRLAASWSRFWSWVRCPAPRQLRPLTALQHHTNGYTRRRSPFTALGYVHAWLPCSRSASRGLTWTPYSRIPNHRRRIAGPCCIVYGESAVTTSARLARPSATPYALRPQRSPSIDEPHQPQALTKGRTGPSVMSSSLPLAGTTGTATGGCTAASATSRPPSATPSTTRPSTKSRNLYESGGAP